MQRRYRVRHHRRRHLLWIPPPAATTTVAAPVYGTAIAGSAPPSTDTSVSAAVLLDEAGTDILDEAGTDILDETGIPSSAAYATATATGLPA